MPLSPSAVLSPYGCPPVDSLLVSSAASGLRGDSELLLIFGYVDDPKLRTQVARSDVGEQMGGQVPVPEPHREGERPRCALRDLDSVGGGLGLERRDSSLELPRTEWVADD